MASPELRAWPTLSDLQPVEVLSEYDEPRLFTTNADDGTLLLAYLYQSNRAVDHFLLVPVDAGLLAQIRENRLAIRSALLERGLAWKIDREGTGKLSGIQRIDPHQLPKNSLPRPGIRLHPDTPFLKLRLSGPAISEDAVPLSVIGRTANSAAGALKKLARYVVTQTGTGLGRPSNEVRQLYDLSAVGVGIGSFAISLAPPKTSDLLRETEKMSELLQDGLRWLVSAHPASRAITPDWHVVVDALSQLVPPQMGVVEQVEVSGMMAARASSPFLLTREQSSRVMQERRRLMQEVSVNVLTGLVREFDKDLQKFILRDNKGTNLAEIVFDEEQYDDALLAFETDRPVAVEVEQQKGSPAALKTLQFLGGPAGLLPTLKKDED